MVYALSSDYLQFKRFGRQAFCFHRDRNLSGGIAAADQVRIFDQFFRCEKSRASEHGGAGLGLTIVQRIVELHGGRLTIDSAPAGPTCLQVDLPRIPDGILPAVP